MVGYYDHKWASISSAVSKVDGLLTKHALYFDGSEDNAKTVIITSLLTVVARHGPATLRSYRINKRNWTPNAATTAIHVLDPDWDYNLSSLFLSPF